MYNLTVFIFTQLTLQFYPEFGNWRAHIMTFTIDGAISNSD